MATMEPETSPGLTAAERAVKTLGGPVQAARVLNVKDHRHQTVQSWLRNRVPAEYCPLIERATRAIAVEKGDADLIVTCEELRPDVQWGVLREQVAPEVPPAPKREPEAAHPVAQDEPRVGLPDVDTRTADAFERYLDQRESVGARRASDRPR